MLRVAAFSLVALRRHLLTPPSLRGVRRLCSSEDASPHSLPNGDFFSEREAKKDGVPLPTSEGPPLVAGKATPCMTPGVTTKLLVTGLSYSVDTDDLREAFSEYDTIYNAKVERHIDSGESKGYGYVQYHTVEESLRAFQALNGQVLHCRRFWLKFIEDGNFCGSHPIDPANY